MISLNCDLFLFVDDFNHVLTTKLIKANSFFSWWVPTDVKSIFGLLLEWHNLFQIYMKISLPKKWLFNEKMKGHVRHKKCYTYLIILYRELEKKSLKYSIYTFCPIDDKASFQFFFKYEENLPITLQLSWIVKFVSYHGPIAELGPHVGSQFSIRT